MIAVGMTGPDMMTPADMASLVDAALCCPHPLTFLDSMVVTFDDLGRDDDAAAAAWIAYLYEHNEIEALMSLQATWRKGRARNPADIAGRVAVPH